MDSLVTTCLENVVGCSFIESDTKYCLNMNNRSLTKLIDAR